VTVPSAPKEIRFEFELDPDSRDVTRLVVTTPVGTLKPFEIKDPVRKARTLNAGLASNLRDFRQLTGQEDIKLDPDFADEALFQLSCIAWWIIGTLFNDDQESRFFMRELLRIVPPAFNESTADPLTWPIVNIIRSEGEPLGWSIPFELFPIAAPYPTAKRKIPPFECFLGLRAPIVRAERVGKRTLTRDEQGKIATLFMSTRETLPGVQQQHLYFRDSSSDFSLTAWPAPNQQFALPALRNMAEQWLGQHQIIHVACHYGTAGVALDDPITFEFGGNCSVPASLFAGALIPQLEPDTERPFVFLNACNTATARDPYEAIVRQLGDLRYDDLIGSRCLLPDKVAGEFARAIYKWLVSSERPSLAVAVVLARRDLVEMQNPAGLLYVHYGSPILRAAPRISIPAVPEAAKAPSQGALRRMMGWLGVG